MNYKKLEDKGLIQRFKPTKKQIENEIKLADRDLRVAKKNIEEDNDWAFAIAYNAVLQASRALMFFKGYRPRGENQHKTVIEFLLNTLDKKYYDKIAFIDKMRVNRHRVLYDEPELISSSEAEFAINVASELVSLIKKLISEKK